MAHYVGLGDYTYTGIVAEKGTSLDCFYQRASAWPSRGQHGGHRHINAEMSRSRHRAFVDRSAAEAHDGWHIHLEGPDGVLPGEDQTGESGSEVGGWPIETN